MLRFAQIGVGARGKTWAKLLRDNPATTTVAYIDTRLAALQEWAREVGEAHVPCFDDLERALAETKPDALLVVTPPALRYGQIMLALQAGIPVLAEKPLADDLVTSINLVREAEARSLQLMVSMNFRYVPSHLALRQMLAEGQLGEPSYGVFTYLRHRDSRRADLNQYALTARQPMLLEQAIHHFDLMRYCYGREVVSVVADAWNPPWSLYEEEANASALMRFEGDLHVTYVGTYDAGWNKFNFRWRTDCAGGVFIQQDQFGSLSYARFTPELALTGERFKLGGEPLVGVEAESGEPFVDDTRRLLASFVESIQAGRPVESSGVDHLRTLALVFACVESVATKRWIDMAEFHQRYGLPA